jgi:Single-strand binding protein family
MFRVAVPGRRDQEASFFTVVVWRGQVEHAAQSLANGSRVVVVGRVVQRASTAEEGSTRPWSRSWPSWGRACGRHGPNRALRESLSTERNDGGSAVGHLGARGQ